MKRSFLFLVAFATVAIVFVSSPTFARSPKRSSKKSGDQKATSAEIVAAAHGWSYVNGEWIHPDGYKFVKNQVLRTSAKPGKSAPEPPGKLALENPQQIGPRVNQAPANTKPVAESAAEIRRKNLEVKPAPQTGSHL